MRADGDGIDWGGSRRSDLVRGTLELIILRVIADSGPLHGWAISRRIRELSDETFQVNQGSLYPALRKLEASGALESTWGLADSGKRARFYALSPEGHRRLASKLAEWARVTRALSLILGNPTGSEA